MRLKVVTGIEIRIRNVTYEGPFQMKRLNRDPQRSIKILISIPIHISKPMSSGTGCKWKVKYISLLEFCRLSADPKIVQVWDEAAVCIFITYMNINVYFLNTFACAYVMPVVNLYVRRGKSGPFQYKSFYLSPTLSFPLSLSLSFCKYIYMCTHVYI